MNVKYASVLINAMHTTIRKDIEQVSKILEFITPLVSNKEKAKRKAKVLWISYLTGGSICKSPLLVGFIGSVITIIIGEVMNDSLLPC